MHRTVLFSQALFSRSLRLGSPSSWETMMWCKKKHNNYKTNELNLGRFFLLSQFRTAHCNAVNTVLGMICLLFRVCSLDINYFPMKKALSLSGAGADGKNVKMIKQDVYFNSEFIKRERCEVSLEFSLIFLADVHLLNYYWHPIFRHLFTFASWWMNCESCDAVIIIIAQHQSHTERWWFKLTVQDESNDMIRQFLWLYTNANVKHK